MLKFFFSTDTLSLDVDLFAYFDESGSWHGLYLPWAMASSAATISSSCDIPIISAFRLIFLCSAGVISK